MSVGGRTLFRDLAFSVSTGDSVAIMGPSGSGKSTLIAGVAGLLPVDSGEIRFDESISAPTTHWLFQSTPLLARRTALDNIAVIAELHGVDRTVALARAQELLDDLGLTDRAHQPAFRLSGGEKQRVAVACALLSESELILADEPTASLDPTSRGYVVATLRRTAEAGAVVVVATHDRWVADRCTRIVELPAAAG